ncbi:MAG: hypothetical protein COA38_02630 [Fluviicola sp.]|nr:MAG: hypothetical protein COA38_02630 [Fluviicola sp.]
MRENISSEGGHIIKNNIREFDPFAAQVLAEYCEQLILKKQNRLNISESVLLKSIEMQCSDEELVVERELAGVIRSAKRILEDTSETEWTDEHKQLFLLLKKIVFVGLDDDDAGTSDSDIINHVVDGLMRLDYTQDIPVFQVVDEERNIFNYIGFILESLSEKFKESTVSVKAVNTYLDFDSTKAFFVTNGNGLIRFASRQLGKMFQQPSTELIDQSIFNFIPNWKGLSLTEISTNQSEETPLMQIGAEDLLKEAYVRLLEVQGDDNFGDLEDEIKEFVVSIDFDTTLIDEDEEIYNNLTSIDSVIDAVKSLKKGNVSPSEHNYSLQTSLESLYRIKYSQLDKLNKVEESSVEFIDPNTIVKSILSELRFHVGFDEVVFEVKNTLIQPFSGDFETIYSILKHLISNAVKYRSPENDSHIHVTFSERDNLTLIEVADNGIGIREEEIEKIFNKGYRGSRSTEGYGLGLYFIQRCLARCKGSISVESELNVGSKFSITLKH